ncbi:hypothetical protein [Methylotuvimicrobium buryatense]|nr:hypothetical protein [Methylotuvimicrobium buryatense]
MSIDDLPYKNGNRTMDTIEREYCGSDAFVAISESQMLGNK